MHRASQAYMQSQVSTIDRGQLVVLLYDAALKFLHKAKEAMQTNDFATKGVFISKALDIINELDNSLSMESEGQELGRNLHAVYSACTRKLLTASLQMNIPFVEEVIQILSSFREAFAQVASTPEAQEVTQKIAFNQQVASPQQRIIRQTPESREETEAPLTSNARASSLYAQKVAEKESIAQFATVSSSTPTTSSEPIASNSTDTVAQNQETSSTVDKSTSASQEVPQETQEKPKEEALSFGGKMPNMNLYKKFAATNTFGRE